MSYLLDSNVIIQLPRAGPAAKPIRARLDQSDTSGVEVFVCSIVRFEIIFGTLRSKRQQDNLATATEHLRNYRSLPFDDAAADHAAQIHTHLAALGTPIGPADLQIAAIALASNLTLITHNTTEFARVPGLKVEDWQ